MISDRFCPRWMKGRWAREAMLGDKRSPLSGVRSVSRARYWTEFTALEELNFSQ